MTTQPTAASPVRHRRIRTTAAITAIVPLIVGGYLATTTIGPDPASPTAATATSVHTSAQMLRSSSTGPPRWCCW